MLEEIEPAIKLLIWWNDKVALVDKVTFLIETDVMKCGESLQGKQHVKLFMWLMIISVLQAMK